MKDADIVSKAMAILGKRGGQKGGKSTSKAKQKAVRSNLAKARKARWPQKA